MARPAASAILNGWMSLAAAMILVAIVPGGSTPAGPDGDGAASPPSDRRGAAEAPALGEPIEVKVPLVPGETDWGIYPALGDFDGDGRPDLLVGGGKGRLRVHRNVGTAARPEFAPPVWFDDLCPNGRIPTG